MKGWKGWKVLGGGGEKLWKRTPGRENKGECDTWNKDRGTETWRTCGRQESEGLGKREGVWSLMEKWRKYENKLEKKKQLKGSGRRDECRINRNKISDHITRKLAVHCCLSPLQNHILCIRYNHLILHAPLILVKLLTFIRASLVTPLFPPTKTYCGRRHHAAWINFKRHFRQREYGTYQGLNKISEKIGAGKFQAKQIQF